MSFRNLISKIIRTADAGPRVQIDPTAFGWATTTPAVTFYGTSSGHGGTDADYAAIEGDAGIWDAYWYDSASGLPVVFLQAIWERATNRIDVRVGHNTNGAAAGVTDHRIHIGKAGAILTVPASAWTNAALQAGFAALAGQRPPGYTQLADGRVQLRGAVTTTAATAANALMFTLPAGLRPDVVEMRSGLHSAGGMRRVNIAADGTVRLVAATAGAGEWINLGDMPALEATGWTP